MKAVLQRVRQASVTVENREISRIGPGLLVLIGVAVGDTEADARLLAEKLMGLRIFPGDDGRFHHSIQDTGGGLLIVSQFTLLGDVRKGRRPSFTDAAPPDVARPLVDLVVSLVQQRGLTVATGQFGAHMEVALINDGPVTILLNTRD